MTKNVIDDKKIQKLGLMMAESENIVFFGGAGVSTESGIPDFRSVDGLYHETYAYPPEIILSHDFFISQTEEFYSFYKEKMLFTGAKPNKAHIALAELERMGKLKAVITQNIDSLHQAAGSKNVLELHGSVYRNNCMGCGKFHGLDHVKEAQGVPACPCGGVIKPDVVLYGEPLGERTVRDALSYIERADMLIVGGTSLSVYPAAGMIDYYHGDKLVLINKSPTGADRKAGLVINGPIGEVLAAAVL
ncbi:MAG: NAD-dependent protein deacylase [Christensenellales bacterium]|jgi:NAD-dependent deacetylase